MERTNKHKGLRALAIATCVMVNVLFFSATSFAENDCDWLVDRVYHLSTGGTAADSMNLMIGLIGEVRSCHNHNIEGELAPWLLGNEIHGLTNLGRFDEAERLVDMFFERYGEETPDKYHGQMYAYRFRISNVKGDLMRAVAAYHQGEKYKGTFPPAQQQELELNVAMTYRKIGDYDQTIAITKKHRANPLTDMVKARALRIEAVAYLFGYPDRAWEAYHQLKEAEALFEDMGLVRRRLLAAIDGAWAQKFLREYEDALNTLNEVIAEAEPDEYYNSLIQAHFRRGEIYFQMRDLPRARFDLSQAIAYMEKANLWEYEAEIMLLFGDVLAADKREEEALASYRRSVTAAEHAQNQATIRAAASAGSRMVAMAVDQGHGFWGYLSIAALFVAFGLQILFLIRKKNTTPIEVQLQPHVFVMRLPPEAENPAPDELFWHRIRYVFTALKNPERLRTLAEDPKLTRLIEAGGPQRNSELYSLAILLEIEEREREGRLKDEFETSPLYQIYMSYFNRHFKSYTGLPVPRTADAWRIYFAGVTIN